MKPDVSSALVTWPSHSSDSSPSGDPSSSPTHLPGVLGAANAWTGTIDLYRDGVFATQRTRNWCTAACVQMMLNMTLHEQDSSRTSQQRYIRYERAHDLYAPRQAKGSDPLGWAAALRHFGAGSDYHDVSSETFDEAIKGAARRLRHTAKPVGLLVDKGTHAWVMTGFSADADPAASDDFAVTHVMVMGPLYPKQKNGYDTAPDTTFTIRRLRAYFVRYEDDVIVNNPWQGLYVTIGP